MLSMNIEKNIYKSSRSSDKYKVRLITKGFTQKSSIDYEVIYSLVVKFTLIWILMFIVVVLYLELLHMNVNSTS